MSESAIDTWPAASNVVPFPFPKWEILADAESKADSQDVESETLWVRVSVLETLQDLLFSNMNPNTRLQLVAQKREALQAANDNSKAGMIQKEANDNRSTPTAISVKQKAA